MIGKVDTCIAFGARNQTVITEYYAPKKDAPEADRELLPGDRVWWSRGQDRAPFDMLLRASGKWNISVNMRSVAYIYNGPPNICLHNITWGFLQSRGPRPTTCTSLELSQTYAFAWTVTSCSQNTWSRKCSAE
jgi:hypothetical protein